MAREDPMAPRRPAPNAPAASNRRRLPAGPEIRAPLVGTKLLAPVPVSGYRERPRLSALLDRGLDDRSRLTLLSAPPGYGKTVAVAGWLGSRGLARAWLSLDVGRQRSRPLRSLPRRGAASGPAGGGRRDGGAVRSRCQPQRRPDRGHAPRRDRRERRPVRARARRLPRHRRRADPPPGPLPDRARAALRPPGPADPGGPAAAARPPAGPRPARRAAGRRPALHGRGGVGLSRRGAAR